MGFSSPLARPRARFGFPLARPRARFDLARFGLAALLAAGCVACGGDSGAPLDAGVDAAELESDAGLSGSELDAGPRPLVHAALWSAVASEDDPYVPNAPVHCPEGSFGEEVLGGELVFYVRTEQCSNLTVRQPVRSDVAKGARLTLRAFHFPLSAPEPGVARMIVRLGDDEVWRTELPIPSPAEELSAEWIAPAAYARGTPLWFHVENHGSNEYALIAVELD